MSRSDFESIKHLNPYAVEFWEARELQPLLGYKSWREFEGALDYMGREELASNLFRITQTEGRLLREQIVGEDAAIRAHYRVGREVRDTLKRLGATMPEDLPTSESIRGELERQRRTRQKILRNKKQQEDQDTLL